MMSSWRSRWPRRPARRSPTRGSSPNPSGAAADADFATLAVPHGAGQVIVAGVTGELAAGMMNQVEALADSLAGQAIRTGKPSLVTGARCEPVAAALGAGAGPLIIVPLAAGGQV